MARAAHLSCTSTLQRADVRKRPYGSDKGTLTLISLLCHPVSDPLNVRSLVLAHTQSFASGELLASYSGASCERVRAACFCLLFPVKHRVLRSTWEEVISTKKNWSWLWSLRNELLILTGRGWKSGEAIERLDVYWVEQLDRNYVALLKPETPSSII